MHSGIASQILKSRIEGEKEVKEWYGIVTGSKTGWDEQANRIIASYIYIIYIIMYIHIIYIYTYKYCNVDLQRCHVIE